MATLGRRAMLSLALATTGMLGTGCVAPPETMRLPVSLPVGERADLEVLVARPERTGPAPLALICHGTPTSSVHVYAAAAQSFTARGFAAAVVMRRGFGHSSGSFGEGPGPCGSRDFVRPTERARADVQGALAALQAEPWVDRNRVLLAGHSTGGIAVSAVAARNPPGVLGVLNFAGGRGYRPVGGVCQSELLVELMRDLGKAARVPALWAYARNDEEFGPELARSMFDAYVAGGAPATLQIAAPFGAQGHGLFPRSPETWWPLVTPFLTRLNLLAA